MHFSILQWGVKFRGGDTDGLSMRAERDWRKSCSPLKHFCNPHSIPYPRPSPPCSAPPFSAMPTPRSACSTRFSSFHPVRSHTLLMGVFLALYIRDRAAAVLHIQYLLCIGCVCRKFCCNGCWVRTRNDCCLNDLQQLFLCVGVRH